MPKQENSKQENSKVEPKVVEHKSQKSTCILSGKPDAKKESCCTKSITKKGVCK